MGSFSENSVTKAIVDQDEILAPYLTRVDRYDSKFIGERLSPFSNMIKASILEDAFKKKTDYERNRHILDTTTKLNALLPKKLIYMFFCYDDDINNKAKKCANYCRSIAIAPKKIEFLALSEQPHTTASFDDVAYKYIARYANDFDLTPPNPDNKKFTLKGCIKRLIDNRWWLRKFRKLITQANEKAAITLNFVNSKRQIYASTITTKNRIAQRLRNQELLSSRFIINEAGQRYSLQEVSDLNVSNPKIRKDELICRARGFEDLAKDLGHEALFITVTCPSKYHRAFAKSGSQNPKWQGLMPDQANTYLNHQWQKTRAELKRHNVHPYGFRVVEPQHDLTPHWHMLFFIEGEKIQVLKNIIRHYALEIDGDEKGAAENRCDFKKIDPSKGSATGYILKYIVKNIDGKGLGEDFFGNNSVLVAQRIDAWASCWCIRQFQQIGGASVSVWRELRRIKNKLFGGSKENEDDKESIIEQARQAADNSNWQAYTIAMGGLHIKHKDRPIKLYYEINIHEQTGECLQSYYDGKLIMKIKGLICVNKKFITRQFTWQIVNGTKKLT
jgi:hypothetical protein